MLTGERLLSIIIEFQTDYYIYLHNFDRNLKAFLSFFFNGWFFKFSILNIFHQKWCGFLLFIYILSGYLLCGTSTFPSSFLPVDPLY